VEVAASTGSDLSRHADAFLRALVARDQRAARTAVDDALAAGAGVPDVYFGVLQPSLYAIGDRWACDELSVADEHFATALAESIMATLSARIRRPPNDGRLAVVTCTPEERHAVGARMVRDLLEADGWEVLDLGAATPAGDLADLVASELPEVVALSTSTAGRIPGVEDALRALRAVRPRPCLVVGGQAWTAAAAEHARAIGADLVVRDARLLAPALERRARGEA
jgi:methanogenic corrinoid protein MtbC1